MTLWLAIVDPEMATKSEGLRIEPLGISMVIGARQPSLRGISESIMQRREYMIAEEVMETGEFILLSVSSPVPVKSKLAEPVEGSTVILSLTGVPSS